jgi:hypothetical protein
MCRCNGLCDLTELMTFVRFSMLKQYNVTVAAMTTPADIDGIEGSTGPGEQYYRAPCNGKRAVKGPSAAIWFTEPAIQGAIDRSAS